MWMEMTKKSTDEYRDHSDKDDMEKRRPKPFRYIANLSELGEETDVLSTSVMAQSTDITVEKLMKQFDSVVGVGDVNAIERVVQKHEKKNKKHDPSIG